MKAYPKAIQQMLISLFFITLFVFIFGGILCFLTGNMKILIFTFLIVMYTSLKIYSINSIAKKDGLIQISGVCTSIEIVKNAFGKYQKVQITDTDYKEYCVIIDKEKRIKIGGIYRLYLKNNTDLENELTNQHYIAFEKLSES